MQVISALFKREFKAYFVSPIAYVFISIFLILTNWLFFRSFFIMGQASMRGYFGIMPWIFLFLVPAVSMRMWAEERKMGTIELLLTMPITDFQAVLGKFLASFAFICVTILLTLPLPLSIAFLGDLDFGPVWGGYLGAFLMGGAYLSIGLFISSLTENQIVAFILSVAVTFFMFSLGEPFVLFALPDFLIPLFTYLGLGAHFESISRGVIDSRDLLYYGSLIALFLFLNVRTIEARKWK